MRIAIACVIAAACGGGGGGRAIDAPPADAPISAMQACTDLGTVRCTQLQMCSADDLIRRWGDLSTCITRQALSCEEGVGALGTAQSAGNEELCASQMSGETCAMVLGLDPMPACVPPAGSAAVGAACQFSAQCASGFCALAANAVCGTCGVAPGNGDSCANQGCGPTLSCDGASETCVVPVGAGSSCARAQTCADGFTCVGSSATLDGTCVAEVTAATAPCDSTHKTGPDCDLDDGLTCNTTTEACEAVMLANPGEPCGKIGGVTVRCAAAATCFADPAPATTSTCLVPAPDGEPCDSAAGPDCLSPAKCVAGASGGTAGTCVLPGSQSCP